jgi:hypothetical protein
MKHTACRAGYLYYRFPRFWEKACSGLAEKAGV